MPRVIFEWDAEDDAKGNAAHIASHGITIADAERVVRDTRNRTERSRSSTYPITFGSTKDGRFIAVVWFGIGTDPEVRRVVTAYDVPRGNRGP